jgi:hypothetical protein
MKAELQEHKEWADELEKKSMNQGSPEASEEEGSDQSPDNSNSERDFYANEKIKLDDEEDEEDYMEDGDQPQERDLDPPASISQSTPVMGLNKKKTRTKAEQSRWEQLYQLNKIQKETKEYFYQALKQDGEKRELDKCTFRPKLNKKSKKMGKTRQKKNFFERKNEWQARKEQKLKHISESKQDKELLHCTFQPQILGVSKAEKKRKELIGNKPAKALNKFIERQKLARKEKQRKQAILNGERGFEKKPNGRTESYMSKFVKTQEGDDEGILKKIRNCSFSNAVLCLHKHLNSFDINLD